MSENALSRSETSAEHSCQMQVVRTSALATVVACTACGRTQVRYRGLFLTPTTGEVTKAIRDAEFEALNESSHLKAIVSQEYYPG